MKPQKRSKMPPNKRFAKCMSTVLVLAVLFVHPASAMTIKEERELSREFKEMVFGSAYIVKESLIADYVRSIGEKLLSHAPPQPFDYNFYVIRDDVYNAFAGPGGQIFINTGLIEIMDNEEELAGILAHEIAHGVHRHLAERAGQQLKVGLATIAGLAAGLLLGGVGIPTEAAIIGALSAGQGMTLAYSREAEEQADKSSLAYLEAAGYATKGLQTILRKMRDKQWFGPQDIPTYLMTHPDLADRMAYVASHDQIAQSESGNAGPVSSEAFKWAHTKLVAMYGNTDDALQRFRKAVEAHPDDVLSRYGYALALSRKEDYREAIVQMRAALDRALFNPHILVDLGRTYFDDGQFEKAERVLTGAASAAADNIDRLYFLGRTQLESGKYGDAISTFSTILEKNEDIEESYYHLGEAYGKLDNLPKAHYHLGIYYKKVQNIKNALFHLERAMKLSEDPEEKKEIAEMLQEVREARKKARERQR